MYRNHLDALRGLATLIAWLENDSHLDSQSQLKEISFIKWLLLLLFLVRRKIGSVGVLEGIL